MKVMLVDDHALFREGLRYMMQQVPDVDEVIEAENYYDALLLGERYPELDLAVLDLHMPGCAGVNSIRFFHRRFPCIPIMVISAEDDRSVMERILNVGAMGYLCKTASVPVLLNAVKLVLSGEIYVPTQVMSPLSPLGSEPEEPQKIARDLRRRYTNEYGLTARQMGVLKHLANGLSNREISEAMGIAEGTVKIHISGLFHTLRVKSRLEAIRIAQQIGLVEADAHG